MNKLFLILPLLLKTGLVCKVTLVAFTKLRKINGLVGLARERCSYPVQIATSVKLVTVLVGASVVKPLLGYICALEDQVLLSLQLKSFIMEKWIWLHSQQAVWQSSCYECFTGEYFLSHLRFSETEQLTGISSPVDSFIWSSPVQQSQSWFPLTPYNHFCEAVWRSTALCI